jgi:hypothetical protein
MRLRFEPVNPGEQAGLCLTANEDFNAALVVALGPRGHPARRDVAARAAPTGASRAAPAVREELGQVPTRSFSAETILACIGRHHFTGAMIGLYATGGGARATVPADVEWFEYSA